MTSVRHCQQQQNARTACAGPRGDFSLRPTPLLADAAAGAQICMRQTAPSLPPAISGLPPDLIPPPSPPPLLKGKRTGWPVTGDGAHGPPASGRHWRRA